MDGISFFGKYFHPGIYFILFCSILFYLILFYSIFICLFVCFSFFIIINDCSTACFVCGSCGENIGKNKYTDNGGLAYCERCSPKAQPSTTSSSTCAGYSSRFLSSFLLFFFSFLFFSFLLLLLLLLLLFLFFFFVLKVINLLLTGVINQYLAPMLLLCKETNTMHKYEEREGEGEKGRRRVRGRYDSFYLLVFEMYSMQRGIERRIRCKGGKGITSTFSLSHSPPSYSLSAFVFIYLFIFMFYLLFIIYLF